MIEGGFLNTNVKNRPARMGLVVALHGAAITALMFAPGSPVGQTIRRSLEIYNVPAEKVPPPTSLPKAEADTPPKVVDRVTRLVTPPIDTSLALDHGPIVPLDRTVDPPPVRQQPSILVDAEPDARFARQFQPDYPSQLARLEIEGSVKLRVLIGADGRVKSVQMLSATDPLFFEATERKALRSWRFRPALRDGVAVESWRVMSVRFQMER